MSRIIRALVAASGLSEQSVRTISLSAPIRYKSYPIKKRSGGERIISQPAREVKFLQRIFVDEFLSKLPVHSSATAYQKGASIKENATAHAHNNVILKYDFKDFFPSITSDDWVIFCKENYKDLDEDDLRITSNLLFWKRPYGSILRLAVGAPSSPILSNILMKNFDTIISDEVSKDYVTYTRYADDLTFSARRTGYLVNVDTIFRKIIRELRSPRLTINEEKTVLSTNKFRRVVTGLVLSDDKTVSLGRDRKRQISASIHHFKSGKIDNKNIPKIAGMLAFAYSIEPLFIERLKAKYGNETIKYLMKYRSVNDNE